jgi:stearoyl-CoA desaturase (delta-9 desaturase)
MNVSTSTADQPIRDWPVILFIGGVHVIALLAFLPAFFSWPAVAVALGLHWLTAGVGVTLGFHRLITHRSFRAPKWVEYFLLFCGTLACQGPLEWVAKHRIHHQHSDTPDDPHDINNGFWWTHVGWILHILPCDETMGNYIKDISRDPVYQFINRTMLLWQLLLGIVLFLIGGWPFVIWGIFVRLVAVYHSTWFVNSATHRFGYQSHDVGDQSTNCWWVALISYGEGWHNNHHAFQRSARHGMRWWEVDMTWMMILGLRALGLAKDVVVPKMQSGQVTGLTRI